MRDSLDSESKGSFVEEVEEEVYQSLWPCKREVTASEVRSRLKKSNISIDDLDESYPFAYLTGAPQPTIGLDRDEFTRVDSKKDIVLPMKIVKRELIKIKENKNERSNNMSEERKRVFLAELDRWQALYIDGEVEFQHHEVAQGEPFYFLKKAKKHDFDYDDVTRHFYAYDSKVAEYAKKNGRLPEKLDDLLEIQEIEEIK